MSLSIHIVAQRDNIMDIPKLLLFLEKFKNLKIKLTILTNPEYLFIGNIELGEREKIIKIYNYYIEKYLYAFPDLQESLQNIIKTLEIVEPHSFNKEEYRHKKNIIDSFLK